MLFGVVKNNSNGIAMGINDIVDPLKFLCGSSVDGAICGAFGVKSARMLASRLRKKGVIEPFAEERKYFDCRFEVPTSGDDKRLYLSEMLESKTVNMLRLGKDALDAIAEEWVSYFTGSPKVKERTFPRTATNWPSHIAELRKKFLPNAELIIFPIIVGDDIIAMGAYFGETPPANIHVQQ